MKYRLTSLLLFGLMLTAAPALAQGLIHDEAVDGDLSDAGTTPTSFVFGLGTNTIQGTLGPSTGGTGATNGSSDADFFTFTLGAGQTITSFSTTRSGPGTQAFVGYSNSGAISAISAAGLDGGDLFTNASTLAPTGDPSLGPIPTTFGAGDHTFIFQETGAGPIEYSATFTVAQVVPEPSSAALLGGLAMVGFIRRRRR